ncbi:hypothetical protein B0H14DRAFT_2593080 [Mycena olivaceomarginata]|nr:hypothetical protein B0H14DRAFT_2593080 [Mycena olivaceomarginata]
MSGGRAVKNKRLAYQKRVGRCRRIWNWPIFVAAVHHQAVHRRTSNCSAAIVQLINRKDGSVAVRNVRYQCLKQGVEMCKEDWKRDERNGGQLSALDPTQDVALVDFARLEKCSSAL